MNNLRYLLLIISISSLVNPGFSQKNSFAMFKYVEVDPPHKEYDDKAKENASIAKRNLLVTSHMETLLLEKGFLILPRDSAGKTPTFGGHEKMPHEVQLNKCLNLVIFWGFSADQSDLSMKLMAVNCKEEVVFTRSQRINPNDTRSLFKAAKILLSPILDSDYRFDVDANHAVFIGQVQQTNETSESLDKYYETGKLEAIEGIYKTIHTTLSEDVGEYRIAIKKRNNQYVMILLDTNNLIWKVGEVKGLMERTAGTNIYSVTFFLSDKSKKELLAEFDSPFLEIRSKKAEEGEIKLIKVTSQ